MPSLYFNEYLAISVLLHYSFSTLVKVPTNRLYLSYEVTTCFYVTIASYAVDWSQLAYAGYCM